MKFSISSQKETTFEISDAHFPALFPSGIPATCRNFPRDPPGITIREKSIQKSTFWAHYQLHEECNSYLFGNLRGTELIGKLFIAYIAWRGLDSSLSPRTSIYYIINVVKHFFGLCSITRP